MQDIANLQGHRLKRSLPAGTALTVDMLVARLLVRRGQQVTLIAAIGPVEIRAQGQALTEGGVADRVRVQNVTSLKVVEGVVERRRVGRTLKRRHASVSDAGVPERAGRWRLQLCVRLEVAPFQPVLS